MLFIPGVESSAEARFRSRKRTGSETLLHTLAVHIRTDLASKFIRLSLTKTFCFQVPAETVAAA